MRVGTQFTARTIGGATFFFSEDDLREAYYPMTSVGVEVVGLFIYLVLSTYTVNIGHGPGSDRKIWPDPHSIGSSLLIHVQNVLGSALAFKNAGIMGNETGNVRLRKGCS